MAITAGWAGTDRCLYPAPGRYGRARNPQLHRCLSHSQQASRRSRSAGRAATTDPRNYSRLVCAYTAGRYPHTSTWLGYALRCLILDRHAFQGVVEEPTMTGPALLIALSAHAQIDCSGGRLDPARIIGTVLVSYRAVLAVFGAGYPLTQQGTFTKTFRAYGFAQSVFLIASLLYSGRSDPLSFSLPRVDCGHLDGCGYRPDPRLAHADPTRYICWSWRWLRGRHTSC